MIALETARIRNLNDPDFALFFIRGLPLKEGFLTYEMKQSVDVVFHSYNRSILFTVATLNAFLNQETYAEQVPVVKEALLMADMENRGETADSRRMRGIG